MLRSTRERLTLRRFAMMLLLTGAAIPVHADTGTTGGRTPGGSAWRFLPGRNHRHRAAAVPDLRPERDLDETAIESYGASTIDELLGELTAESGDDDETADPGQRRARQRPRATSANFRSKR